MTFTRGHNIIGRNKLTIDPANIRQENGNGFEIVVNGYEGDRSAHPVQVFLEIDHDNKLRVYVWDGSSEDYVASHTIERLP